MRAIIALCALLAGITAEAQPIYRWVDDNGRIQYTDKPPREYMARNRIRYAELDVEKSAAARAEYQRLGGRGVPVILAGTQRMDGYSEERFAQMLKAAGY